MSKLVANLWGCGDDCHCWYTRIYRKTENKNFIDILWEGRWMNDYDHTKEELEEIKEEFQQACHRYDINIDLTSNCPWNWKGEKDE
jgi:hypothetical protein